MAPRLDLGRCLLRDIALNDFELGQPHPIGQFYRQADLAVTAGVLGDYLDPQRSEKANGAAG